MKIEIHFVKILDIKGLENGSVLDVAEGITIQELLALYHMKQEHQKFIVPVVNGGTKKLSYSLQGNDKLELYLPVGGG